MVENNSKQILVLQAGRAFAALAVVIHHSASSTVDFIDEFPEPIGKVLEAGWLGVDFFFVLSGFIIYHTTKTKPRGVASANSYIKNRVIRVFVPYLPISIFLMLAYTFMPALSASGRSWSTAASLTLLPIGSPALTVAWTLQHELLFYGIFALGFFSRKTGVVLGAWILCILAGTMLDLQPSGAFFRILLAKINLEFAFGVGCAMLVTRPLRNDWALYGIAAAVALMTWAFLGCTREASPVAGLGIAALIVPLVRLEQSGILKIAGWISYLGVSSYALYLVHNPLLALTVRVCARITVLNEIYVSTIVGVALSIVAGCLYYSFLEKPVAAWVRKRLDVTRRATW